MDELADKIHKTIQDANKLSRAMASKKIDAAMMQEAQEVLSQELRYDLFRHRKTQLRQ